MELFLSHPSRDYYLHELERELSVSAGNIRRELTSLIKSGLFQSYRQKRLVYYKIDKGSALFGLISTLMKPRIVQNHQDIVSEGLLWITKSPAPDVSKDIYCQTRDIFQSRLETFTSHLEKDLRNDAYLIAAVSGEIGNNSFDHNLGNWPDISGIFFAHDQGKKAIVLADRGRGILATIRNVKPDVANDYQALKIAFTKIISGRAGEKRGNGLKFVAQVIREKKWNLHFESGKAHLEIDNTGKMSIYTQKRNIKGCFAVLKY